MALISRFVFLATLPIIAACAPDSPLERPTPEALAARAPDTVRVRFETSKGAFVIEAYRGWAPNGADRFFQLAQMGYYDGVRFFRVLPGFMAQFGLHGSPRVTAAWRDRQIPDDSASQSNTRGTVTFATSGPNTRTTQIFINLVDNRRLDELGFTPFGKVVEGMSVVDSLFSGYGEGVPYGQGPDQARISAEGNAYLERDFPKLDHVIKTTVLTPTSPR